jgi:hypothetical protein
LLSVLILIVRKHTLITEKAKSAADYLISKEISANLNNSYGERRLVNKCSDNVECSEKGAYITHVQSL